MSVEDRIAALETELAELREAISRLFHGDRPKDPEPEPLVAYSPDGWSAEHDPNSGGAYSKRVAELRQRLLSQAGNPAVPNSVRRICRDLAEHRYLTGPIVCNFSQDRWNALRAEDVDAYVDARNSYGYHSFLQDRVGNLDVLPPNKVQFPPVTDFYNPEGRMSYEGTLVIPNCDGSTDEAAYDRILAFVEAVQQHGWGSGTTAEDWA